MSIKKKIVLSVAIVFTVTLLAVAIYIILLALGYPLFEDCGELITWQWDPFSIAFDEFSEFIVAIIEPLEMKPFPNYLEAEEEREARLDAYWASYCTMYVLYFLDKDFTYELEELDRLIQKSEQGDKRSRDQRAKAKRYRAEVIQQMEEAVENIRVVINYAQKFKGATVIDVPRSHRDIFRNVTSGARSFTNSVMRC